MMTSPIHRHAKPFVKEIVTALPRTIPDFTDQVFVDSIVTSEKNLGVYDVVSQDGRVLDRVGNLNGGEYTYEGGRVVCALPGSYILRTFNDISHLDAATVQLQDFAMSEGSLSKVGVLFWPEILSQASEGAARLSLDCKGITFTCSTPGQYAFSYRLRNYLGQVSETACVFVTVV